MINHQKGIEFIVNRQLERYIGLQNHDAKSKVSFRNIRIKEDNIIKIQKNPSTFVG